MKQEGHPYQTKTKLDEQNSSNADSTLWVDIKNSVKGVDAAKAAVPSIIAGLSVLLATALSGLHSDLR